MLRIEGWGVRPTKREAGLTYELVFPLGHEFLVLEWVGAHDSGASEKGESQPRKATPSHLNTLNVTGPQPSVISSLMYLGGSPLGHGGPSWAQSPRRFIQSPISPRSSRDLEDLNSGQVLQNESFTFTLTETSLTSPGSTMVRPSHWSRSFHGRNSRVRSGLAILSPKYR